MPKRTVVLITGGSGFIGSCYARTVLRDHPDWTIRLLDVLTYAGTLVNIAEFDDQIEFVRGDVAGQEAVNQVVEGCTYVIHFAAEALGWSRKWSFADGLSHTIDWYRQHERWWRAIRSQE
jgi:dTDP-D-glucose 4,6-dehydratase